MKNLRTKELADLLGVTPQTIRKYVNTGKIPYHKTPGGQLFFNNDDVSEIIGEREKAEEKWAYYIRSSSGRKSSFNNQIKLLEDNYPKPIIIIKDSASGLNEKRKGLEKLIKKAQDGTITDIAITNPDRLTRFGVKYLEELFTQNNVKLHFLNSPEELKLEEELLSDFMSLIASFSGRFYKLRSKENKQKLLKTAQKELEKQ